VVKLVLQFEVMSNFFVFVLASLCVRAAASNASSKVGTTCSGRGGCDCDCSWASPSTCNDDDGSCCFGCCCGSPSPSPSPGPVSQATYCLNAGDLNVDYGAPQLNSNGWTINGGARVSSKASFNFAGGFIEFDMDLSGAHGNVNNNFYLTYPQDGHSYCDSGGSCTSCCAEFDLTENNGNCFQSTTWHTDRSGGDHDGKAQTGGLTSKVHVKASWNADGTQAGVDVGANHHSGEGYQDVMTKFGAVFYSSQWTGWVPGSCGGDGNLGASSFSVSNVRIQGNVVQGPEPTKCAPVPTPTPTSPPTPPPTPTPPAPTPPVPTPTPAPTGPSPPVPGCPGGSMEACMHLCPGDVTGYKACVKECDMRCPSDIVI